MSKQPLSFTVDAGPHIRRDTPVVFDLPRNRLPGLGKRLPKMVAYDPLTRSCVPVQAISRSVDSAVRLAFVLDRLEPACTRRFELHFGRSPVSAARQYPVDLNSKRNVLEVHIGGALFTTYNYGREWARPFFYPFLGPCGEKMTRGFPVDFQKGETRDHKHHKSVWVAHGDLNGTDNWMEERGHGYQIHQAFSDVVSGPVMGTFTAENAWIDFRERPQLSECRRFRFWGVSPYCRIMDAEIEFTATDGDVIFGDTKEGGIISVRVASSMDAQRGGQIVNAQGGIDEAETWGKPSPWCDYSGPLENGWAGIAILDHPKSFRHPTHWHVRDYGLMTANPFGTTYFYDDKTRDGSALLRGGETMRFCYRLIVHWGDAQQAAIAERYHDFANPPQVVFD